MTLVKTRMRKCPHNRLSYRFRGLDGALADAYEETARQKGHEVRRQNLGDLRFDPILWHGYQKVQELEPDLLAAQASITWCDHWVIIYPIWWGSVPALLKGFFDRALYSGFATDITSVIPCGTDCWQADPPR